MSELASLLKVSCGVVVESSDWDRSRIPEHLTPHFRIIDGEGKIISQGRDLQKLKERHLGELRLGDLNAEQNEIDSGLLQFPDIAVPQRQILKSGTGNVLVFPGIEDRKTSVALKMFGTPQERDMAARKGLPRLVSFKLGKQRRFYKNEIKKLKELSVLFSVLGDRETFEEQILFSAIWNCFFESRNLPSTSEEFEIILSENKATLTSTFYQTVDLFTQVMTLRFSITKSLAELDSVSYQPSRSHIENCLDDLVPKDFLNCLPPTYSRLLPRFLEGISYRVTSLPGRVLKDRDLIKNVVPLEIRLAAISESDLYSPERYYFLKFYVEELMLAIFASQIAKRKVKDHPIDFSQFKPSLKRVEAAIEEEEKRIGIS